MSFYKSTRFIFLIVFSLTILLNIILVSRKFSYPLGPAQTSTISDYVILDLTGVLFGIRRMAADISWIQLLQYYGSPDTKEVNKEEEYEFSWTLAKYYLGIPLSEKELHHHHHGHSSGVYKQLLDYCIRVAQLDPFFYYVYLYGAGALTWNPNRSEEAIQLLKYGINNLERYRKDITKDVHEPYWQMHLYLSAIIYKKHNEYGKMKSLLETAVKQKECPNMIKSILANIYQKEKLYMNSLKLWLDIYESNDLTYKERSQEKINELRGILGL